MQVSTAISKRRHNTPLVLGLESSCDETAAALVTQDEQGEPIILSSVIASQNEDHAPFGGVVPEIAARAHLAKIHAIIDQAVRESGIDYADITAVSATAGPGLVGGVITGLMAGKGLAMSLGIPFLGINHLEGHALSPRLAAPCPFPYLLLLISGGHTQLISVDGLGDYHRLGSTVDDAAGEAFDKTAKHMGLGFPGGPRVEKLAASGDETAYQFPRPFHGKPHANFSFAGLKTSVARAFDASDKSAQSQANIAASFQRAVCDSLYDRCDKAAAMFKARHTGQLDDKQRPYFVVAGGVAANRLIRARLTALADEQQMQFLAPPLRYCTDNAAMIALAGLTRLNTGTDTQSDFAINARPRWPLDAEAAAANPASGFGKKGPKS